MMKCDVAYLHHNPEGLDMKHRRRESLKIVYRERSILVQRITTICFLLVSCKCEI